MNTKEQLKAYQDALDSCCLVTKTDLNGVITYANELFCESIGYTVEELLGKTHNIIRHPDATYKEYEELWSTILSKNVFKKIFKNKTKDNKTVYYKSTLIPITNKKGKIKEFLAIRYDVTSEIKMMKELKSAMQSLLQKEQILMHQTKLDQMGEMIGMIAHQWRQPLSAISATTIDLDIKLALNQFDQEHFSKKLKNISEYTENLSSTIDDFRNFFKKDSNKEITNYENIINSVLSIISMSLRNNVVTLDLEYLSKRPIHTYVGKLQQMVLNILKNMENTLLNNDVNHPKITIKTFAQDDFEVLEIIDNNKAIKEQTFTDMQIDNTVLKEQFGGTLRVFEKNGGMAVQIALPYVQ